MKVTYAMSAVPYGERVTARPARPVGLMRSDERLRAGGALALQHGIAPPVGSDCRWRLHARFAPRCERCRGPQCLVEVARLRPLAASYRDRGAAGRDRSFAERPGSRWWCGLLHLSTRPARSVPCRRANPEVLAGAARIGRVTAVALIHAAAPGCGGHRAPLRGVISQAESLTLPCGRANAPGGLRCLPKVRGIRAAFAVAQRAIQSPSRIPSQQRPTIAAGLALQPWY
jgi:hypothetical protein